MKNIFLASVLIAVFSSARADDNAQIQSLSHFKDAYQDYANRQEVDKQANLKAQADLERELHQLVADEAQANAESKQEADLKTQASQLQANLEKARALVVQASGEADLVRADQTVWQRIGNFFGNSPQQIKDEKAAQKAYKDAQDALKQNQALANDLHVRVAQYQTECDRRTQRAQVLVKQVTQISSNLSKSQTQNPQALSDAANSYAQSLYANMRMRGYDARFILQDVNQLQQENQLNQAQMGALKDNLGQLFENSLLGKYVNDRIGNAMKNEVCEAQNRCAIGTLNSAAVQIKQGGVPAQASSSPQVNQALTKSGVQEAIPAPSREPGATQAAPVK
jgi:hypothetical protein